jgi:predicted Zn-dependent protease
MDAAEKAKKKGWLYGVGGGLLGGAAGFGLGKLLCRPQDKKCLEAATLAGAAGGVGAGLLIQKYKFMANTRENEMEADRIGFRTSVKTGYDKDHVGTFYSKLLEMEETHNRSGAPVLSSFQDAMATHPPSRERVVQMQELAAQQRSSTKGVVTTSAFEKIHKRAQRYVKA